ncbi:MAG: 4-hydroxy-tetrahydrodipicolinate synthase [Rikenellaceae bacterium]|nr:4-hydroxy-tetrahydrodipicolinate synthase [Rikenellaceae bacterium]MCL2692504.1 4-hydroxy-tetrahydrodipicolinate synthase [Rikenellaceae bacterium]
MTPNKDIRGVGVALITPFDDRGAVDYDAFGRVVDHVTQGGVDYLVVLGTTSEVPTLRAEEKRDIVVFIKEHNAGRLPVVVGCGGYDTEEVVRCIGAVGLDGVSALLSVTPYYNKPSQEGLYQHYKRVAEESPVPVLLYNVPSRTGVNMTAETTLRLAHEVPNLLGIKEACGTVGQMMQILCGRPSSDFLVISGDDVMALPLAAMGGDGIISVAANAFPSAMSGMMDAAAAGNYAEAAVIFRRLYPALEAIFAEGNPTGVKAALALKGVISNNLRLPMVRASRQLRDLLERLMAENGL